MKKLLSMILVLSIVIGVTVFASTNESEVSIEVIDSLLREANTPENEIEIMDEELKRMIYNNSLSCGNVEFVDVTQEQNTNNMARAGYAISTSDLKLSVLAYKSSSTEQVDIYPTYEWLVPVKPKGKDYFGYSTHSSFSAVPGERSNILYYKLDSSDSWHSSNSATYTGTSTTGYQHSGSSLGSPDSKMYLKGHFYYKVDIDSSSPVKKIVLAYVHDTSLGSGMSYSVGYGPFSISVSPSSSDVGYQNNIYNLNY